MQCCLSLSLMPMTHAPETGTENPYQKTCTSFLQVCHAKLWIGIDFVWYRNLVRSRKMFYVATRCRKSWPKWRCTDWSTIASCVVCLYNKLCCLLFYCFKINWEDSSIEKLIQKFCFQSSGTKNWYQKTGTSFLVPVFGTGFWCVCLWHKSNCLSGHTARDTTAEWIDR